MISFQVFAEGYYVQPYQPLLEGAKGNFGAIPYVDPIDRPLGYMPSPAPETNWQNFMLKQDDMYRLKQTEYLNRSGRARACDEIQANPAAQRQCYMGLW